MKTIYKYPFGDSPKFEIRDLPEFAPIIRVGLDPSGNMCIWAEVFTEWVEAIKKFETEKSARRIRTFEICGTGHECPAGQHLHSYISGPFVWHLYETTART